MVVDPVLFGFFIVATMAFILTPGPVVSLIIVQTMQESMRSGFAVSIGAGVVSLLYMAIYLTGFANIMALSDQVLVTIRYAGAAYLLFLAWQAWNREINPTGDADQKQVIKSAWGSFRKSVLISLTSPKMVLFFAAFFPQFMTNSLPYRPQIITLSITFMVIAITIDIGWVLAANKAKALLAQKDRLQMLNKISGAVLASGALLLLVINT